MQLGQTTEEYANSFSDVWIKGFKDGVTRIRFCQEPEALSRDLVEERYDSKGKTYPGPWITWQQHYWRPVGYFPCSKQNDCVGCNHPDERTRELQRQYYFNALDENGRLNVYRLGTKAYKIIQARFKRMGTILERDFNIVRSGEKLDTTYVPEPGDKYDVEIPDELHDIRSVLGAKYLEAQAAWDAELADEAASITEPPAAAEKGASKPAVGSKATEGPTDAEKAAAARAADESLGEAPKSSTPVPEFEDWGTPDIKAYLEERKVEFGARTPRGKLIEMAKESVDLPPF